MQPSGGHLMGLFTTVFAIVRFFVGSSIAVIGIGAIGGIIAAGVALLFGKQIVAGFAAALISVGAYFIRWTGSIFNFFVDHLIVKYSATLTELGIMDGINTVWTAFRDVGNIVLIGLFVFLAINIILGVKAFGEKRTIARVLIIAVLLNFSLLFTKIIIDAANFTAYQFYKSAGLERTEGSTSGGVADAFLVAAGISTIGDTYGGVRDLASEKGTLAAVVFAVVAGLLMLTIVMLFAYGAFQMIARGILLAFLMVISPLAFVSWLVPSSSVGAKWSEWWQTLISSAFFAPLFMITLWASMLLMQSAATVRGGATLGEFFSSPAVNTHSWKLIMMYCFVVGLLYASIKFASTFANSIAGYGMISQGMRNALFGVPAFASRFGVAPFLRQTAGWYGYGYEQRQLGAAKDSRDKAGKASMLADLAYKNKDFKEEARQRALAARHESNASSSLLLARKGASFAGSKMNVMDTGIMKTVMKQAGVGFSGESAKGTKGYADQLKVRAETAQKDASKISASAEEKKEDVRKQRELGRSQLEAARKGAEQSAAAAKQIEGLERKLTGAKGAHQNVEENVTANRLRIEQAFKAGTIDQQQRLEQHQREDSRLETSLRQVSDVQNRINELDKPVKQARERLKEYEDETEDIGKEVVNAIGKSVANIAGKVGRRSGTLPERAIGTVGIGKYLPSANKEVEKKASDFYKKKVKTESLTSVFASLQADSGAAAPAAAAPAPKTK